MKDHDSLEQVTEELQEMGLQPISELKMIQWVMESREQLIAQLLVIMGFILIVAITGLVISWQSILRDRSKEIGIMKAIGASSAQIIGGLFLEGIMLMGSAVVLGLLSVSAIFAMIQNGLPVEPHSGFGRAIDIEGDAIRFLFEIPILMYPAVFITVVGGGILLTYLVSRHLFHKDFITLLKKG